MQDETAPVSRRLRRRLSLFRRGADAFAQALAQSGCPPARCDLYVCPLCLDGFTEAAVHARVLTDEHAPPRACGGRPLVLTCKRCNNSSGHQLDAEMVRAERPIDVLRGEHTGSHLAHLSVNNGPKITVRVSASPTGITLLGRPAAAHREHAAAVQAEMTRFTTATAKDYRFRLHFFRDAHRQRHAQIGWLRAAYLVAFARFGYTYACGPALAPVREQIRQYDHEIIPTFHIALPAAARNARHLLIVESPTLLRGLAVHVGRYILLLPYPGDTNFYARVHETRQQGSNEVALTGKLVRWPITGTYLLDVPIGTEQPGGS